MRALLTPLEQIPRPGAAAVLDRLPGIGSTSDCERCGEPRVIVSEERIAAYPAVFELCSHCTGCGLIFHIRQALEGPV
jgi:hypothetical protein